MRIKIHIHNRKTLNTLIKTIQKIHTSITIINSNIISSKILIIMSSSIREVLKQTINLDINSSSRIFIITNIVKIRNKLKLMIIGQTLWITLIMVLVFWPRSKTYKPSLVRALAFGIYCQINIRNKYIIYNLINKLWRVWNYNWLVCCNDGEATNHNAQSKKTWRHSFSVGDPVPPKLLLEEKFEDKVWEDGMVMGLFSNELVVCRDALLSVVVQTPLLSSRDFDSVSLNVEPHSVIRN